MSKYEEEDKTIYRVLVNEEEQYSLWPEYKDIPLGWRDTGTVGPKQDCLDYVKEVWTDMRPLSLRKWMEEQTPKIEAERQRLIKEHEERKKSGKNLKAPISSTVTFLAEGSHPVNTKPTDKTVEDFKASLDRKYVHVNFTDTKGGTCLGIQLDEEKTDLSKVDFKKKKGSIHVEGVLILDYVRVRCIADINLPKLEGSGHLDIIEEVSPASLLKEQEEKVNV